MSQPAADDEDLSEFLAMAMGEDKPVAPEPKAKAPEPDPVVHTEPDVPINPSATVDEVSVEEFLETTGEAESATTTTKLSDPKGDDPLDFLANTGTQPRKAVPNDEKPWMKHHVFTQVKTVEEVNRIVDECIKRGFCSLDLETQGLDNRIVWKDGKPDTVHQIVGYCISYDGIEGFYIPIRHRPTDGGPDLNVKPLAEVNAAITRLCRTAIPVGTPEAIEKDPLSYESERPPVVIGFWNAQFDQEFLFPVTGIDWWHPNSFEDGMLACFTKYAGDKGIGLKIKAKQLLRDPDGNPYEMVELRDLFDKGRKIQFDTLAPDEPGVLRYAGSDAICTYKLCQLKDLVSLCRAKHAFTYRLEKQTTEALRPMERNRVRITRDRVKATLVEQEKVRDALLAKIHNFARDQGAPNLDPNSPKQLSEFLFGSRPKGLDISPKPDKNEASGQYKTDGETLEELAKAQNAPAILKDIVRYREAEKFIGTYLRGLAENPDANSELRFSFKQTGAASGRFSAPAGDPDHGYSGVPVHGIPADSEVRRNFLAREGYTMLKADYAGEELRIAANVSGERVWIDEFLNGSGDLHSITARAFFNKQEVTKEERNSGKIANFSLLYGGGPAAIVRATGCDRMEAARRKQAFDKAVPIFAKWIKGQHAFVKKEMGVRTAFGRWLPIPDANNPDGAIRSACERHSVNYVIQGAAADIMKIVLVMLHKALHRRGWLKNGGDDSVRMLLTVHDEVVFEVRHDRVAEVLPIIVEIMESPWRMPKTPEWRVPLVVEPLVGFNWGSGYKVERAKTGHKLGKDEVLINGFVYSTTRKPKIKNDKIVESLDTQEELVEGKNLFRVINPPWLMGRVPGEPGNDAPSSSGASTPSIEDPAVTVAPETVLPEGTAEAPVQIPQAPVPDVPPLETTPAVQPGLLRLGINQLNEQTAEQVCSFVIDSIDNDEGEVLHLTDIVGETLVSPDRNPPLKVVKDKLIGHLRRHNLLCLPD